MIVHSHVGRMKKHLISKTLISVVCLCLCASLGMAADNPVAVVKTGTDQVLQLLREYPGNAQVRREKIRAVVDNYFDFDGIAKNALGPHWKQQPNEKQQEFTRDFGQLLFNAYIRKIERYTNEKITYNQTQTGGDYAVVRALVVGDQVGEIPIDYHLRLQGGNWKVYDVVIEGVGLVTNYRSQFDEILSRNSFDDLLNQLKRKNAQG
jgi:phospholipid transport system substrate-binding protein